MCSYRKIILFHFVSYYSTLDQISKLLKIITRSSVSYKLILINQLEFLFVSTYFVKSLSCWGSKCF